MLSDAERPKRLSLSQIVEMLLTRGDRDRSSVSLTRNAKGETQIEVTVRTGEDAPTIRDAETEAQAVYDRLRNEYPATNGELGSGSSVSLTRNAKGETQIDVTVKTGDSADVATLAEAEKHAEATYDRLRRAHPLASGYVGAGARDTRASAAEAPVTPPTESAGNGDT